MNKKINQLSVRTAVGTDLALVGDPTTGTSYKTTFGELPLVPTSRTITINGVAFDLSANRAWTLGTVTSVGLSMPPAFSVANSPITSTGTLAVTALGTASQYIRGDGQLATLPSGASGGSSVAYYLNGGTAASVGTYYQMSTTAVLGAAADFSLVGNGLISQFLTDVGDPNRLEIPGGNWNFEMYFNISSSGGNTAYYVELLKYNGSTFTSIASNVGTPEEITGGTSIDLYLTSLAIPQTTLLVTDRLALRVYIVNNSGGRTVTLHTQDSNLCEIITNFAGGVAALNGLTANTQYFATGTSGTDFGISSISDTHTFNLPTASATNRGALSSADWTTFNNKVSSNIYTADGTLSGNRTLTANGNSLTFLGGLEEIGNSQIGLRLQGSATTKDIWLSLKNTNASGKDYIFRSLSNGRLAIDQWNGSTTTTGLLLADNTFTQFTANGESFLFGRESNLIPGLWISVTNGSQTLANSTLLKNGTQTLLSSSSIIRFFNGSADVGRLYTTTGNWVLQNGGTFSDAGYRLDVNGTARVSGNAVIDEIKITRNGTTSGNYCTYIGNSSWGATTLQYNTFVGGAISVGAGNRNVGIGSAVTITGTANVAIGHNTVASGSAIAIGGSTWALANTLVFGSTNYVINAVYFGSGVQRSSDGANVNGASASVSLNATGAAGTDFAGGNITIAGGKGTGTGTSGDVIISTATPTTTGTTLQTLTERVRIYGSTGNVEFKGVILETTTTNRQTASYSLVLADRGKLVEMNSASANTLTVPLNSAIAFPIGSKIDVTQYGAGATTITATSGVTIRSFTSFLKIAGQYAACTLVKIGTDEWYCYGNLIA